MATLVPRLGFRVYACPLGRGRRPRVLACLRFSRGARVVLLGACPATIRQDVLIMETRVILPAVLVLLSVAPRVGRIQTQLSKPLLVPGLGPIVLSP